jgi:D-alanyl-D-alanine-carboxypeptidase/D-alanyl-D-alanine-endopeptidase
MTRPVDTAGLGPRAVAEAAFRPIGHGARDLSVAILLPREELVFEFLAKSGGSNQPLYEVGSLTKPMTAELLASMVGDGTVDLSTTLGSVFANVSLPADIAAITLEALATHQSRLPRLPRSRRLILTALLGGDPYRWISEDKLLSFLKSARRTADAGTYSNFGFGILGLALGRVDGGGYAAALRSRILGPLGLTDTLVEHGPERSRRLLQGHSSRGSRAAHWHMAAMAGAGGVAMSIGDGARWLAAHVRAPAWFEPIVATVTTRRAMVGPNRVGLAWCSQESSSSYFAWHNGGTAGFTSFAAFDRARQTGIIAFAASAHTPAFDRAAMSAFDLCSKQWGLGVSNASP